jgi:hypothetical protein
MWLKKQYIEDWKKANESDNEMDLRKIFFLENIYKPALKQHHNKYNFLKL